MAVGYYVITSLPIAGVWYYAGEHVTDAGRITNLQNGGAQLWPDTDAQIAAAAALAQAIKNRGGNVQTIDTVMAAAVSIQGASFDACGNAVTWSFSAGQCGGMTGVISMIPPLADRAYTITDAYVVVNGAATAPEQVTFQMRRNGNVIAGAAFTYTSASTPGARNPIPNMVGLVLNPGDVLDYITVYQAGGNPALKGIAAYHELEVRGK